MGLGDPAVGGSAGRSSGGAAGFVNPFSGDRTGERTRLLMRYLPRNSMSVNDMFLAANDKSTDDDQMIDNVNKTRKLARAAQYVSGANSSMAAFNGGEDAWRLQQQWERMSGSERSYLRSIGMDEPINQHQKIQQARVEKGGDSIWDQITSAPGDALDFTVRNTIGSDFAKPILEGLNMPLQTVNHTWRAMAIGAERSLNQVFYGGSGRENADYLNEQDGSGLWAEVEAAWEDAGQASGEGAFLDATKRDAWKQAGKDHDKYALAYYQAIGLSPADAAMRVAAKQLDVEMEDPSLQADPQWQAKVTELYQQASLPRTQAALRTFTGGHMSPGRMFTNTVGIHEGDFGYDLMSGSVDMAWDLTVDPVLIGGKVYKGVRGSMRAFDFAEGGAGKQLLERAAGTSTKRQVAATLVEGMGKPGKSLAEKLRAPSERQLDLAAKAAEIDDMVAPVFKESGRDMLHPAYMSELNSGQLNEYQRMLVATADLFKGDVIDPQKLIVYQRDILGGKQSKILNHLIKGDRATRLMPPNLRDLSFDDAVAKMRETEKATVQAHVDAFDNLGESVGLPRNQVRYGLDPEQFDVDQLAVRLDDSTVIRGQGLDSVERVAKFLDTESSRAALAGGAWDNSRFIQLQLPNITRKQLLHNKVWAQTRLFAEHESNAVKTWHELQDLQRHGMLDDADKVRFSTADRLHGGIAQTRTAFGNFLKAASTPTFRGQVPILADDSLEMFQRALRMGTDSDEMWQTWSAFAAAPSHAARRKVAEGAMDSVMRNLGIPELDNELYNNWLHLNGQRAQHYGLSPTGNFDVMGLAGSEQKRYALYLSQVADDTILMPDFKTMREAVAKGHILRHLEGGVNSPLVSKVMERYWKPLMILRMGFVPRVIADELLPWAARAGFGSPMKQWFVQPWHMYDGANELPPLLKGIGNLERWWTHGNWAEQFTKNFSENLDTLANPRAAYEAGQPTAVHMSDLLNRRGMRALDAADQQYLLSGRSVREMELGGRDAQKIMELPDKRWAKRFAAYNMNEIKMMKKLQQGLQKATKRFMTDGDFRAIEEITHNHMLLKPHLDEVTTHQAGWLPPSPRSATNDSIPVAVGEQGGQIEYVNMRAPGGEYVDYDASAEGYRAAVANHAYTTARDPAARDGMTVYNAMVTPDHAAQIGHNLGYELTDIEGNYRLIRTIRQEYTEAPAKVQRLVDLSMTTGSNVEQSWAVNKLLNMDELDDLPELRNTLLHQSSLDAQAKSALYVDERRLFDDVWDEHLAAQREADGSAAGRLPEESGKYTRDEFGKALADAQRRAEGAAQHEVIIGRDRPPTGPRRPGAPRRTTEPPVDPTRPGGGGRMAVPPEYHARYGEYLRRVREADPLAEGMDPAHWLLQHQRDMADDELGRLTGRELNIDDQDLHAFERLDSADPEYANQLFDLHRQAGTGIAKERKWVPVRADREIMPSRWTARDEQVERVLRGDRDAARSLAEELHTGQINRPRNNERYTKMARANETADGRQAVLPEVDAHVHGYIPQMDPVQLQKAIRNLTSGPLDPDTVRAVRGFVSYQRGIDPSFELQTYLDSVVEAGKPVPVGRWATTEEARANAVMEKMHAAAGTEAPLTGGVGHVYVPVKRAEQGSLTGMADNEMYLDRGLVEGAKPYDASDFASRTEITADHSKNAANDMFDFVVHDNGVNHVIAHAIASGRPTPWHMTNMPADLLPQSVRGPKLAVDPNQWSPFANGIRTMFDGVGRIVDGTVRHPMWRTEFGKALIDTDAALRPVLADEKLAYGATRVLGVDEADEIFRQTRTMNQAYKGWYANAEAEIDDPIMRAAARGQTPRLSRRSLAFAEAHGDIPPIWKKYLDDLEAREARITVTTDPAQLASARAEFRDQVQRELDTVQQYIDNEQHLNDVVVQSSAERATNQTLPFIDDHRQRSQMSEIGRNVIPFFWAQEQTARRWIGSVAQNPAFIHQLQLGMHGMRSMGMIRKDQYGEDVFVYPGSKQLQELVSRAPIFGDAARVAVTVPLTGQVAYTVPFLQDMGVPSAGPIVTVPLRLAAETMPELGGIRDAIVPAGTEEMPWYNDLFPSVVSRTIHAIGANADGDRDFAAAQLQAMSSMEQVNIELSNEIDALQDKINVGIEEQKDPERIRQLQVDLKDKIAQRNKVGVPDQSATADEVDGFMERLAQQTRVLMVTKAILGFAGPIAPHMDLHNELTDEYRQLLKALPVNEAYNAFLKAHPDMGPWTVANTEAISGRGLSTLPVTSQWINDHTDVLGTYKFAAPWVAPQGTGEGYDAKAFNQQMAIGLRHQVGVEEQYKEMKFKEAAPAYFQMQEDFELAQASAGDTAERKALAAEWADWRDSYLSMHRTFAEHLRSPESQQRRQSVISEMQSMVTDPRVPQGPEFDAAREVAVAHAQFVHDYDQIKGERSGAAQAEKLRLRSGFLDWGDMFARENPRVRALWEGIYRQEVDPKDLLYDTMRAEGRNVQFDTPIHKAPQPRAWATDPRY